MQSMTICRCVINYTLIFLLATLAVLPAMAEDIKVVQSSTMVDKAENGVPVINIATPNKMGISYNTYEQFNVGEEGVILNNSIQQETQTNLADSIQSNPNLNGNAAEGIVNEVISPNPSILKGSIEIAGAAVPVLIVNPYGITCDGCDFINTPHATLSTGQIQFDSEGQLTALDVKSGMITLNGAVKITDGNDKYSAFSLLSRAIKIDAIIRAQDLHVVAGANLAHAEGGIVPQVGSGSIPSVAIDSGALGGMFLDRIQLIASEKGLGVNLNNLVTRVGDVNLDVDGKITLENMLAKRNIDVSGAQLHLKGIQSAQGEMILISRGNTQLDNASLFAENRIVIQAEGQITSENSLLTVGASNLENPIQQGKFSFNGKE